MDWLCLFIWTDSFPKDCKVRTVGLLLLTEVENIKIRARLFSKSVASTRSSQRVYQSLILVKPKIIS